MFKLARPFFIIAETPLHAGSGSDLGVVDMPIQRERHTDFPKIEASSLKGCIREAFEGLKSENNNVRSEKLKHAFVNIEEEIEEAISLSFGPENTDNAHAGALGFTDARLLLFPVKSMKGVFAWITCPRILERFKNDLLLCDIKIEDKDKKELTLPEEKTRIDGSNLIISSTIILEEYSFELKTSPELKQLAEWISDKVFPPAMAGNQDIYGYWRNKIKKDIVVLSDDDFRDFINLSTEVITRTKINNNTGTVEQGGLFTEEYLPSETILYSLALTTIPQKKDKDIFQPKNGEGREELVMEFFEKGLPAVIQLGGNATIGKGLVRTKVMDNGGVKNA